MLNQQAMRLFRALHWIFISSKLNLKIRIYYWRFCEQWCWINPSSINSAVNSLLFLKIESNILLNLSNLTSLEFCDLKKNRQETWRDGFKRKWKSKPYDQYVSSSTQLYIAFCVLVDSTEITAELYRFTFSRKSTRYLLLSFCICPYECLGGNHKSSWERRGSVHLPAKYHSKFLMSSLLGQD